MTGMLDVHLWSIPPFRFENDHCLSGNIFQTFFKLNHQNTLNSFWIQFLHPFILSYFFFFLSSWNLYPGRPTTVLGPVYCCFMKLYIHNGWSLYGGYSTYRFKQALHAGRDRVLLSLSTSVRAVRRFLLCAPLGGLGPTADQLCLLPDEDWRQIPSSASLPLTTVLSLRPSDSLPQSIVLLSFSFVAFSPLSARLDEPTNQFCKKIQLIGLINGLLFKRDFINPVWLCVALNLLLNCILLIYKSCTLMRRII